MINIFFDHGKAVFYWKKKPLAITLKCPLVVQVLINGWGLLSLFIIFTMCHKWNLE